MSAAGAYLVTPHAVRRFQERIAPLPERHALAAIIRSLANPPVSAKLQKDGVTVRIRTRHPWKLRAFVAPPTRPGDLPCVVTVFEG